MAINHYETALFLLWILDAYREPDIERRICPAVAPPASANHRWSRYPHPFEVELSSIPDSVNIEASRRASATAGYEESAKLRPIPMVNVTPMPPASDDDDISSFMEVSHFASKDNFIPVVHRHSDQLPRSSQHSVRSTRSSLSHESAAVTLQRAAIEDHRNSLKLDQKFDKLSKPEDFDWWHRQTRNRLQHEAWEGILEQGEPYATTDDNRKLSNKLGQRLNQCMTATVGNSITLDAFDGRGLEML